MQEEARHAILGEGCAQTWVAFDVVGSTLDIELSRQAPVWGQYCCKVS